MKAEAQEHGRNSAGTAVAVLPGGAARLLGEVTCTHATSELSPNQPKVKSSLQGEITSPACSLSALVHRLLPCDPVQEWEPRLCFTLQNLLNISILPAAEQRQMSLTHSHGRYLRSPDTSELCSSTGLMTVWMSLENSFVLWDNENPHAGAVICMGALLVSCRAAPLS